MKNEGSKGSLRERILGHAGPKFFEEGFSRITTEELSRELGISKKTLYREFSSKEEILREVVHRRLAEVDGELTRIFDDESRSFIERIGAQMQVAAKILNTLSKPFLSDLSRYQPGLWEEIQEFRRRRVFDRMEGIIRAGEEEGMVDTAIDPKLLVRIIVTVADHLIVPEKMTEPGMNPQKVIQHIGILVGRGILTDYGRSRIEASGIIAGEGDCNDEIT